MDFLDFVKQNLQHEKSTIDLNKIQTKVSNTYRRQYETYKQNTLPLQDNNNKSDNNISLDVYKAKLKQKLLEELIKQWITPSKDKKYLAVTDAIGCPLQVYLRKTGKLQRQDIETNELFYLLSIYGKIGDTVHNEIYRLLEFEHTEKFLYDKDHRIRGRFDIIDNGILIDIKSSRYESDHSPQLALYVHLARLNGYTVNRAGIWYVLLDKVVEYDINKLEEIIPKYLERSRVILQSIDQDKYPPYVDESHCKYCPIKEKCKTIRQQHNIPDVNEINHDVYTKHDNNNNLTDYIEFDIDI